MAATKDDEMWSIDYEQAKDGVWWWWFWLAFFENPDNPEKPLQLMVLWSTKKETKLSVNGVNVSFEKTVLRKGGEAVFDGAVASWFFDGRKMRENFVLTQAPLVLDSSRKFVEADGARCREKRGVYDVAVDGHGAKISFHAKPFNVAGKRVRVHNRFFAGYSYDITKANELAAEGLLEINGRKLKLKGTAYFQKVIVNAPVMPWLWGIVHFKDGSFMSYFCPRVGTSLVRKDVGALHNNILFKSKFEFYCAADGKYREYRPCRISSHRTSSGPVWKFSASGHGESIETELKAYAGTSWKIQNGLAAIFRNALHYDEYCVRVSSLRFRRPGKPDYTMEQSGEGTGNAEHSWGFLF